MEQSRESPLDFAVRSVQRSDGVGAETVQTASYNRFGQWLFYGRFFLQILRRFYGLHGLPQEDNNTLCSLDRNISVFPDKEESEE